jgi:mono/diheme cytochrome c family protein
MMRPIIEGFPIMNMRTFSVLTGALSLVCVTAVSAGQTKPAPGAKPAAGAKAAAATATPASITNGAALYKRQCVMCHGATGAGDGAAAKSLKGKLPSLTDKGTMAKMTDEHIHEVIAAGKKSEIGSMPALGKRLKPEEITDIVNYVRTLSK